jgi:hypothetical protein
MKAIVIFRLLPFFKWQFGNLETNLGHEANLGHPINRGHMGGNMGHPKNQVDARPLQCLISGIIILNDANENYGNSLFGCPIFPYTNEPKKSS